MTDPLYDPSSTPQPFLGLEPVDEAELKFTSLEAADRALRASPEYLLMKQEAYDHLLREGRPLTVGASPRPESHHGWWRRHA